MSYFETTNLANTDGDQINPTTEESTVLLRRLIKLLESNSVVDSSLRQKVVVEQVTATQMGTAITGLNSGAGVPASNVITAGAPTTGTPITTYYLPVWVGPVDQRWEIIDRARTAYNTGIRSNLTFN